MDATNTLYDLYRNGKAWHRQIAAWVGANPKKTVTAGVLAVALAAWKLVEIAAWVA